MGGRQEGLDAGGMDHDAKYTEHRCLSDKTIAQHK